MKCSARFAVSPIFYRAVFLIILGFCQYGQAAENNFTTQDVVTGMTDSEDAFTDLRLEYVSEVRVDTKGGPYIIQRTEATYALKKPGPLRYLNRKSYRINMDNGDIEVMTDGWSYYDGNATYTLDRNVREGKPKRGYVRAGYDPNQFPMIDIDPHTYIFYFGKRSIASIIQQNKGTFRVEQGTESIEGVPTVEITGSLIEGKLSTKMWISPERNYLPLKIQRFRTPGGSKPAEILLSDLIQLPSGLWYPKKIISGVPPDYEYGYNFYISDISVDPIPVEFFTPVFPEDTEVTDEVLGIHYEK